MELPIFRYHPDPLATGSIVESDAICRACGQARGYIYTGPVYSEEELDNAICPWCIADGSAHARFDAEFADMAGIGCDWEKVPPEVEETVAWRTPGFMGWQQEMWWTHCGDAGAFLGRAGYKELKQYGQQVIDSIAEQAGITKSEWDYMEALDKEGSPTAYVFRCLHCGAYGGYSDCD